ncbi:thioesterase family protein [Treponema sp. TIM-1]|uniref:thioesterase family protein n=1 Tax=Treponema sp. TIM-1 TaxID=2898417 RepID=UPI003980BBF5
MGSKDMSQGQSAGFFEAAGGLRPGMKGAREERVTEAMLARAYGSGGLPVYATPAMAALMEGAAVDAVDKMLPEGWSTVGTELAIRHLAPTPPGMLVRASAELAAIDGRQLEFRVEAEDGREKIGEGTHRRFIINNKKFTEKAEKKKG